ncbi:MAG TPA: 3-phosphoserine/phosphohydroxythreonine transaminase [Steroidobacteraceae bacterium]
MRVYNFAAGPAMLPLPVMEQVRAELTDWQGRGMSVMELSHRSKAFMACAAEATADLRELLAVPANYQVLFMQGGATAQFAAIPLNLAGPEATADYVNTGAWAAKAIAEAKRFCRINAAADAAASHYTTVPPQAEWRVSPQSAYLHYTANETIGGVEFPFVPEVSAPLVADMSSNILSRPIDVNRFGLIYASAQKNIGPAGLSVVIVRDDLLGKARPSTPAVLDYQMTAKEGSMLNTPPTFAWYVAGLVFKWMKREGGLKVIGERNRAKAAKLYRAIDDSGFYRNPVAPLCRSWMNVPFVLERPELELQFLGEAGRAGLANLEGHRSVGGMRASLYNAMPEEGVDALIEFMRDFARRNA